MAEQFDITKHMFVPEHIKLSPAEKDEILNNYGISFKHLPRISISDPAIANLSVKKGDVIKIVRKSKTAGEIIFYRGVENE
jgi:DNA-directed RNA polymerase subunit H (RpoH/RPB5)